MFSVRPVEMRDIGGLELLAAMAAPAIPTIPRERGALGCTIERSDRSFSCPPQSPGDQLYFFVLEDAAGEIAGAAGIQAAAGARGNFVAFRREVFHQVSRVLDIRHDIHTLALCTDLTGRSQLSGFFIRPGTDRRGAALLSRARLMFAAEVPQGFSQSFIGCMAGVLDDQGRSPLWEAIGRKFFQLELAEVERLVEGARDRTQIVELMPHYPVYIPLLPVEAQRALGQVHTEGRLAQALLHEEGFRQGKYVDILDGGAILEAERDTLRSVRAPRLRVSTLANTGDGEAKQWLVANARSVRFRAVSALCVVREQYGDVWLPDEAMRRLDVIPGDLVRCVES